MKKWLKKALKFLGYILAIVLTLGAAEFYARNQKSRAEKLKEKKARAKAKLYKKVNGSNNRSDDRRKKLRDSASTIIKCLTLISLLASMVHAEYVVFDEEDQVWRDYGSSTNYIRILEAEKRDFLSTRKSNITIITNEIEVIIDKDCTPTWWEENGDIVLGILGFIGGLFLGGSL